MSVIAVIAVVGGIAIGDALTAKHAAEVARTDVFALPPFVAIAVCYALVPFMSALVLSVSISILVAELPLRRALAAGAALCVAAGTVVAAGAFGAAAIVPSLVEGAPPVDWSTGLASTIGLALLFGTALTAVFTLGAIVNRALSRRRPA